MLPDRVSNPGPLTYESGALPIALRGPASFPEPARGSVIGIVGLLFGLNVPLRQYFSLYRAVSQRQGERKEK